MKGKETEENISFGKKKKMEVRSVGLEKKEKMRKFASVKKEREEKETMFGPLDCI